MYGYRKCKNCGKALDRNITKRRQFCGDKCRVEYNRKSSVISLYNGAITNISKLGKATPEQRKDAMKALKALKKAIDAELLGLGDEEQVEKRRMFEEIGRYRNNV